MSLQRAISSLLVVALVAPAALADPRTVQVLKTQGKIDAPTRAKIDAAILEHAKGDASATAGDITFADAAAALGCKPDASACRDEVREMLAVDEVVYATAAKQGGGIDVTVYRITRGGTAREMKTTLAAGQPVDKLDGVAPLFASASPPPRVATVTPVTPTEPPKPATTPAPSEPAPTTTPELLPTDLGDTKPATTTATQAPITTQVDAPSHPNRRLQLAGMIAGGAMVFVGFMCWGAAADLQDQVDAAPTATRAQLMELQDLEKRGDGYAGLGNFMFVTGAVLGGISTYYFVKGRRRMRASTTATRITPVVFDHGAGVTIGGSL